MRSFLVLISFLLSVNAYSQQKTKDNNPVIASMETAKYGKLVPIMLGIHNEHTNKDSLKIELINDLDSVVILHQGKLEGWGMSMTDKKIKTGKYHLILSWYENEKPQKTQRDILIKPETEFFSLNIELANDHQKERVFNGIYLDQYTRSLKTVEFKRKWDPLKQFKKDSILLPEYTVTNKNDSTLYGAYLRFSSMLSINWVQPHYIAFMKFEQKKDSDWVQLGCNAPRMEMGIKKGATGKTYKDMILGCPVKTFKPGNTYNVRIDYMLNDAIYEKNPKKGEYEANVYVEQTIYMYTDEFELK
jgi:hypothetical protein